MPKTVEGGILFSLQKYHGANSNKLKNLIINISELTDLEPRQVRFNLDRTITQRGNAQKSTLKAEYYQWVSLLHFVFNEPLEALGISRDNPFYKHVKGSEDITKVYELKNFGSGNEEDKALTKKKYSDALKEFLKNFKSELYVYDYLERQCTQSEDELIEYYQVQDELFKEIESHLDESVNYVRILALPLRYDRMVNYGRLAHSEVRKEILKYISVPLFKHIFRCLDRFPEMGGEGVKSGFYMLSNPTRTYHYATLRSPNWSVSEYFRYNRLLLCKPDLMYIEQGNNEIEKMSKLYYREIKKHMRIDKKLHLKDTKIQLEELLQNSEYEFKYNKTLNFSEKGLLEGRINTLKEKLRFLTKKFHE